MSSGKAGRYPRAPCVEDCVFGRGRQRVQGVHLPCGVICVFITLTRAGKAAGCKYLAGEGASEIASSTCDEQGGVCERVSVTGEGACNE